MSTQNVLQLNPYAPYATPSTAQIWMGNTRQKQAKLQMQVLEWIVKQNGVWNNFDLMDGFGLSSKQMSVIIDGLRDFLKLHGTGKWIIPHPTNKAGDRTKTYYKITNDPGDLKSEALRITKAMRGHGQKAIDRLLPVAAALPPGADRDQLQEAVEKTYEAIGVVMGEGKRLIASGVQTPEYQWPAAFGETERANPSQWAKSLVAGAFQAAQRPLCQMPQVVTQPPPPPPPAVQPVPTQQALPATDPHQLLARLNILGMEVVLKSDGLYVRGAKEYLTPELKAELAASRAEIIKVMATTVEEKL